MPAPTENPPKLLYTCVRSRAYPFVLDKGIHPSGNSYVILSSSTSLAERIGRRFDQNPVKLTVQVKKTLDNGNRFLRAGQLLFLTGKIPPDCFSGPPLPKEKPETHKPEPEKKASHKISSGSFLMDLREIQDRERKPGGRQKRKTKDWQKDRRKQRKMKDKWQQKS